jgi:hemerythrin-like domain-containing protein
MKLLDELEAEHQRIDRALGALRAYAGLFAKGTSDPADGFAFLSFFEIYVGRWHHEREESLLFPALERDAQLPADRGPIPVLLADHASGSQALDAMRDALSNDERAEFERIAREYTRALWSHIDAENSVLFPESEQQLRRNQIHELPLPVAPDDVREAAARADALIERYGEGDTPDVIRGAGCVMCAAYGESCRGVEHEWWNEWQWEEFDEHVAAT